jgi:hypothetical protein
MAQGPVSFRCKSMPSCRELNLLCSIELLFPVSTSPVPRQRDKIARLSRRWFGAHRNQQRRRSAVGRHSKKAEQVVRKIERYRRSFKNRILLEHYYLPGQLEARLAEFVDFDNNGATIRIWVVSLRQISASDADQPLSQEAKNSPDHRVKAAAPSAKGRLNFNPMAPPFYQFQRSTLYPLF